MGLGPIVSAIKILYREKLFIDDFGAIELKEAFVAQALSCINVFLVLIAKGLNPDIFVVARANQDETEKTLYTAGTDKVVSPFALGARRVAHAILRPTVIHFLELTFQMKTQIFM